MTLAATKPDAATIVDAIAEQLRADMDKHLFGRRARAFLQLKLRRLEELYGPKAVKAALRLRRRADLEQYRESVCREREFRERERRHFWVPLEQKKSPPGHARVRSSRWHIVRGVANY
jgi:hypothetical protein